MARPLETMDRDTSSTWLAISDSSAGRIRVFDSWASLPNSLTYCSAMRSETASAPPGWLIAVAIRSMPAEAARALKIDSYQM